MSWIPHKKSSTGRSRFLRRLSFRKIFGKSPCRRLFDEDALLKAEIAAALLADLPVAGSPLHDAAAHHHASGGKMLRGMLAMSAGLQAGLARQAALDWAVAIEHLHNASLVHDDLCDDDLMRRNRPSVWNAFGRPMAICLGDWMIGRSFARAAAAQAAAPDSDLTGLLADTLTVLSNGQAGEFCDSGEPDLAGYAAIVSGKTTPLFVAAVEGCLRMAGRDGSEHLAACHDLFSDIGIAYQIGNDLEDHHALCAGEMSGDLTRNAPNAVYISFRNTLAQEHCDAFDLWRHSGRPDGLDDWLARIAETDAEARAAKLMQAHLKSVDRQCAALSPDVGAMLLPIFSYLAEHHAADRA